MAAKDADKVQEVVPAFEKSEIINSAGLFGTVPEIMAAPYPWFTKTKSQKARSKPP